MSTASGRTGLGKIQASVRALLLGGFVTAIGLLVAEAALRILRLAPVGGVGTVTMKEYERVPGIFGPNQRVLDVGNPALPYNVRIDSLGFRGPDFTRAKPSTQLRVLMIGDSFVYGDFVEDDETLPAQLEKRIRTACPDVLVINAGLGGSTIIDQAFMLQRALPLDPDLVILVFFENDFGDLALPVSEWQQMAQNRAAKSRFPLSILYPVLRKTALWNLGLRVRAQSMNRGAQAVLHPPSGRDSAVGARLRERYGEALTALRDTLTARGVPLVFAMYPSWLELQSQWETLTWMARFAEAHAIHGVNLLPTLQATHLPATKLYLIPKDGHPSPLGYSIAADSLIKDLLSGSFIPLSCRR